MDKSDALPPSKFRCDQCGGVFDKAADPEEVLREMRDNWGEIPPEDRAIVCDECYAKFMAWASRRN